MTVSPVKVFYTITLFAKVMKVKKIEIPEDSLVNSFLPANYSDAFSCDFNTAKEITADDIQVAFWTKWPKWIERLFKIRNLIVRVVGLKGDRPNAEIIEDCIRNNKKLGDFFVVCKSENETVIKLSDKHLDAYMSVYLSDINDNRKSLASITVVDIHNRLGYLYFYSICPFHKIVVKGMLKQAVRTIDSEP